MGNLLLCLPKLNKRDLENIAFAVRRHGYLTNHNHYLDAANAGELPLLDREVVIDALHKAASLSPAALATARKLEEREGPNGSS
jgi:hypothetical protein